MSPKKFFILFLTSLSFFCSMPDSEMTAVFRGDSPLYFNKTSVTLTESEFESLTLNLQSAPDSDVIVDLSVGDSSEIEIDPAQIIFSADNYDTPQTINILAKDDCSADGTQDTEIIVSGITSTDTDFSNSPDVSIPVTVEDSVDNLPRIVFFQNSDMITSELGTIAFFKVNISCAPNANVAIPLVVDQPGEVSLDKTTLTFTPTDFATYQTVTVTGLSDCTSDADKTYHVSTGNVSSTDGRFSRYADSAGTSQITSLVEGTNLNYPVTNDLNLSTPQGSLDMTLDFAGTHPDQFISFSASLTCPPPGQVYFSLSFTDVTNSALYSNLNPYRFAKVINTSLGNTYFSFNTANWATPQNVLIQLDTGADSAYFDALFPTGIVTYQRPYTDNLIHKIKIYQAQGDVNETPVTSPIYQNKILNTHITIN